MICPYCGSSLPDGADFCEACGMFTGVKPKTETDKRKPQPEPENDVLKNLFSPAPPVTANEVRRKKQLTIPKQAQMIALAVLITIAVLFVLSFIRGLGRRRGIAGIGEPVQIETTGYATKDMAGYEVDIYYQYSYEIEALVVHTKRYPGFSLASRLAPVDVAMAWGSVAEYNDKIDFHWRQSHRWVHWRVSDYSDLIPVGGEGGVGAQCSNNHLIPADSSVKRKIKKLKKGDHIKLTGYLVNVDAENKSGRVFTWNSSTSRYDTGDGACEVIYVKDIIWLD